MQQLNVIPRSRLCDELGISRSTIKRWIETRHFPKPLKASLFFVQVKFETGLPIWRCKMTEMSNALP